MHRCRKICNFEVFKKQSVTYVLMCKGTTNNRNEQVQTDFFDLFDVKKKVEVSFTAPDMTNLGGLPVLLRVMRDDDFLLRLSRQIHDWRNPDYITHTMSDLITQRVLQIAAGYEDADDCDLLRHDSMMKLAVGRLPGGDDLCSQPTMTRLENHVGVRELYAIGKLFMRHFVESYDKEPDKIVIDLDDSNADTYGCQQLSLFNTFYGGYCYMPLFVFEGVSGKLMLPLLRPGRTSKRTNVFRLIRRIILFLRKYWKHTVIVVRGDSMFCSHEFMEWAEGQERVRFITGLSGNSRLYKRVAAWVEYAEERYRLNKQDIKEYHRFMYRADKWSRAQWVVVKIERNAQGQNIRFIVTDMYWHTPQHLYEKVYCKRGDCELYIKEMKDGLRADRMSCGSFLANQFRLFLHAAAYVLVLQVKQKLFAGHETLATATILTLRKRVIWQTARITELKTKIKIEFQRDNRVTCITAWINRKS